MNIIPIVENAVSLMIDNGYQGIDVDWEHSKDAEEAEFWNEMMKSLKIEQNRRSKKTQVYCYLTTALPPWGDWIGNVAPLFSDDRDPHGLAIIKDIDRWVAKFPKNRLVLGLSFCGLITTPLEKAAYEA